MADVDAVRHLASERDLEFVDLDNYGVDPAASDLLPVDLARRHHLAVVKRKFGTPVIATADPDDADAHDAVRDAIGRDFISVVATSDQIGKYLDRLFPPEPEGERRRGLRKSRKKAPEPTPEPSPRTTESEALGRNLVELDIDDFDAANGDANGTANGSPSLRLVDAPEVQEEAVEDVGESEPPAPVVSDVGEDVGLSDEADLAAAVDTTGTAAPEAAGPSETSTVVEEPLEAETTGEPSAEPHDASGTPELSSPTDELAAVAEELAAAVEEPAGATEEVPSADDGSSAEAEEPLLAGEESEEAEYPASLEVAAEPELAATDQWREDPGVSAESPIEAEPGTVAVSEAESSERDPGDLADFVVEAVASYQEQHAEDIDSNVKDVSTTSTFPSLAKALVEGERVSVDDMRSALEEADQSKQNVAHVLMSRGLVTEADLMWGMAQEMGLEFVDLDTIGVNFAAVSLLPEATARHHNVIVIAEEDGRPVVATSNPTDVFAMDDLRTIIGRRFKVVVAARPQISSYIDKAFDTGADEVAMEASIEMDGDSADGPDDIQAVTEEAPIVRYVNLLILQALNERASDIHIEPTGGELRIRYRIDGVLHDISTAPRSIRAAVTTRLKVMADMNIAEHRIPQDGRISLNVGSKSIDLRMATLPTINGEKVVMRVLDKSSVVMGFSDLGFDDELLQAYGQIYTKPYGTILVTGPTGSGKSTTLYTTLTALNSPDKNIITVEDPVELPLKGISQIQLNPKAGLTFASALRAILRSDPDIVLVGEIRDRETALIAVEAALTGHLVLSTLHTNNAASTPMRLVEMGLEPFLVTSALTGVLAQRLARRLCLHCKEAYEPNEAEIVAAGWTIEEVEQYGGPQTVYRSIGCSACSNTGYRGRKALAEFLPMTEEVERMIIEGGSMEEIHRLAVSQGMVTLRQSGLRKALEGETTLEEVLRVVA